MIIIQGPGYMTTETHQRFTGKPADDTRMLQTLSYYTIGLNLCVEISYLM